jgi:PAS domain S-box-containing protein
MATREAPVHENVERKRVESEERDTALIFRSMRNTARIFRNSVAEEVVAIERRGNAATEASRAPHPPIAGARDASRLRDPAPLMILPPSRVLRASGEPTETPAGARENHLTETGRADAVRTGAGPGERLPDRAVLASCLAAAASVFALDLLVDYGHMAAVPYAAVVAVSLIGGSAGRTRRIATLASILCIAAYTLLPEAGKPWEALAGRLIALLVIWSTALLGNQRRAVLSRLRLRDLAIHSASNGIVLADATRPGCPIIYANQAFERMTGYRGEEIIGRELCFPRGGRGGHPAQAVLRSAIAAGRDARVTIRDARKDGTPFWNECSLSPIRDRSGALTHFIAIHEDVTEQKDTEEQLEESMASTQAILEAAVNGILTIDESGVIQSVNSAVERIFGYPKEEILGSPLGMLIPPHDREEFDRTLSHSLKTGNTGFVGATREIVGQRKDGTTFPAELGVGEARVGDRRIFAGIVRDLTERRRAREALLETERRARAAEALASIGTLTAGLAHEVGGPMNVILGYAQMIESSSSEETVRDRARIIREQVSRISKIIETLLAFARPRPVLKHPVQLKACLDEVLNFLSDELRKREVAVERRFEPVPAISGDGPKLQQLFLNLFLNAIDAMPEGGTLRVSLEPRDPDQVEVRVADSGTGIAAEELGKIFEPFFTSKPRGKGSGLGLAVAKGIVSDHDARIDVASELGKGTEFLVSFPLERAPG